MRIELPIDWFARRRETLAPSRLALGPNTYLGLPDFMKMLALAFMLHVALFAVLMWFPHDKVTHIPVRALQFKLSDAQPVSPPPGPPAPVLRASAPAAPVAREVKPAKPVAHPRKSAAKPAESAPAAYQLPAKAPAPAPAAPAIPTTPQQYVREVPAASPPQAAPAAGDDEAGGGAGGAGGDEQAIRARYEQQISQWIEQHKIYPQSANGAEGRVVVRMRIDRGGTLRYHAIEQSSGYGALDAAAIDMVRRANPMPPVPANYPASNLIEFLIPINFRTPGVR